MNDSGRVKRLVKIILNLFECLDNSVFDFIK